MPNDDVTDVRRIRHEISEECGHDIRKVVAYYRGVQNELKRSGEFRFEERSFVSQTKSETVGGESTK